MYNEIHATKNTHQLAEGDVIKHYGAWFVLTERKVWPMRADDCPAMQGDCITFVGVEVAREVNAQMPKHWTTNGYSIQGNKLAHWCIVTAE